MNVKLLILLPCFFYTSIAVLHAQSQSPEIRQAISPNKGFYEFPAFSDGSIIFRNGIISGSRLNYNISLDEMHFIDQRGDTLCLAEPGTISFINLNGVRFYYDKGYLQTVDSVYTGILLVRKLVLDAQQQRDGGYGIQRPHEGTRTYNFFGGNKQRAVLGEDEPVLVSAKEIFLFGDVYGHFAKANKAFILQLYSKQQDAVAAFIKDNHINFSVKNDLLKLAEFCRGLK